MKKPISLWIFGSVAVVINFISLVMLFFMFVMQAQRFLFFTPFILSMILLVLLLIISSVGVCHSKKWGYYIFIIITLIMNLLFAFLLLVFPAISFVVMIFLACFMVYFLKPSTRELFKG